MDRKCHALWLSFQGSVRHAGVISHLLFQLWNSSYAAHLEPQTYLESVKTCNLTAFLPERGTLVPVDLLPTLLFSLSFLQPAVFDVSQCVQAVQTAEGAEAARTAQHLDCAWIRRPSIFEVCHKWGPLPPQSLLHSFEYIRHIRSYTAACAYVVMTTRASPVAGRRVCSTIGFNHCFLPIYRHQRVYALRDGAFAIAPASLRASLVHAGSSCWNRERNKKHCGSFPGGVGYVGVGQIPHMHRSVVRGGHLWLHPIHRPALQLADVLHLHARIGSTVATAEERA
jgi:hypothetical protein